jgi:pyruvate kinase
MSQFIKTKILATVGPASNSPQMIEKLIKAGTDGIRLNFSHADLGYFRKIVRNVRTISNKLNVNVSIVGDLQGPKIRVGKIINGGVELKQGQLISITNKSILGNQELFSTNYRWLSKEVISGDKILIDDGRIKLEVKYIKGGVLTCKVIEGGFLKEKKGLNLPGVKLKTPSITNHDLVNIAFSIENKLDLLALSFVRSEKDILQLKKILEKNGSNIPVIAKIELLEGVNNFEKILHVSDGVMIARGDLGVELEPQEVPVIQKMIIKRCVEERKLVITATQMLDSMINNPLPTRAEASDVANAVFDGTDVAMLSGETSIGKYPIRAVEVMNKILSRAEEVPIIRLYDFSNVETEESHIQAIGKAAALIANEIYASAIIPITLSGYTAIVLSKYNPKSRILAITESLQTSRFLNMYRNIFSFVIPRIGDTDRTIIKAKKLLLKEKQIQKKDTVIFVGSLRSKAKGVTNLIKIETV